MRERVGGVELHYEITGEGEPVVFLHGYPLSGRLWDETVREVGPGFRRIVPELRGHGESEASERADMARYADDVAELLDALGETRPMVLVGLSMGGYVAFELIRRHGDRVRALVLVDTRAGPDMPAAAEARRETAERVLREGMGAVADEMAERLFGAHAPRELRSRWREIMAATPPTGAAAALRAMADRPDSLPTLQALRIPVLVVVGEEDAIAPPAEAERMANAAAGAELEVVKGAGHMTPVERPEAFGAVLRRFLTRL